MSLHHRRQLFWKAHGLKKQIHKVATVNGKDVREIGRGESPRVSPWYNGREGIHAHRHACRANLAHVSLLHQIPRIASTRPHPTLQADDVPDSLGFGQSQQLF